VDGQAHVFHRKSQRTGARGGAEEDHVEALGRSKLELGTTRLDHGEDADTTGFLLRTKIGHDRIEVICRSARHGRDGDHGTVAHDDRTAMPEEGQLAHRLGRFEGHDDIRLATTDERRGRFVTHANVAEHGATALGHADRLGGLHGDATFHRGRGDELGREDGPLSSHAAQDDVGAHSLSPPEMA